MLKPLSSRVDFARPRTGRIAKIMQTKKAMEVLLAESFKKLVTEKPIEKITIREITDGAGVIRVTFYNHFQDKYELLEWICRSELMEPVRPLVWNGMQEEALRYIFTTIEKQKEFYRKATQLEGQNSFEAIIRSCFAETLSLYLEEHATKKSVHYDWLTPRNVGIFYAQELTYVLLEWIRGGLRETPEEMVKIFSYITNHSLIDLAEEF